MLSYKLDFSSCACKPGFVKSSHICVCTNLFHHCVNDILVALNHSINEVVLPHTIRYNTDA